MATGRFLPNLDPFKETLLQCDFFKDIVDDQEIKKELVSVPLHFNDEQHYTDVYLPLFWEETKMQLHRAKFTDMGKDTEPVEISSIHPQGKFIKVEVNRTKDASRNASLRFMQSDLVLLTQNDDPREDATHFLAMVENSFLTILSVSVCLDTTRGRGSREANVVQAFKDKKPWRLVRICGLSTQIREYEGLMSFPHLHLNKQILNKDEATVRVDAGTEMQAAPAVGEDAVVARTGNASSASVGVESNTNFDIPPKLSQWLQKRYNTGQQAAIQDCRKLTGITLVQGPPGTGKTTTVLGILAALLSSKGKVAKSVSYSRAANCRTTDGISDDDDDMEETEEDIKSRGEKRLARLRRAPWFQGGYVPWADSLPQQLLAPGDTRSRFPYPKVPPNEIVPMSEIEESIAPQKVLVCTPSNAAIDQVLRRIIEDGIVDGDGVSKQIAVCRLGPNSHPSLKPYNLEEIVNKRLTRLTEKADVGKREEEKERALREVRIVCATLSVAGSRDIVGFPQDFDTVVIDEASQGVEISTLVPLKVGCRRLIMVGDPKQLPATCFSTVALAHKYEQSLFQRLQESQHRVSMLDTQYRMHPKISHFPSVNFYDGKLLNGLDEQAFEKNFPTSWSKIPCFGPVAFFHLKGSQRKSAQSWVNEDEARFVISLYQKLETCYPSEKWIDKIAVISPYAEQVGLIRQRFREIFGVRAKDPCPIDVNTVDGFQGREKDCIIVSVVRAESDNKLGSIGFVRDTRRMNVAFTRARTNLWVVGHMEVLKRNSDWRLFITQQQESARLLRVSAPFENFLGPYLDNWFGRHPDVPRPDSKLLCPEGKPESVQEVRADNFNTGMDVEDVLFDSDAEGETWRPDVEEAPEFTSDIDDEDVEMSAGDSNVAGKVADGSADVVAEDKDVSGGVEFCDGTKSGGGDEEDDL